ncbi:MAG: HAD-IB family phosphatase [Candidatus Bathyarchaeota archaeon]|nr:MAG: HAD-IB family phosphatase [Candidatus Bathyarchaeota archaeon]
MPKNRYLIFELGRSLDFLQFMRLLFFGFLYEIGVFSLESALKGIFNLFKGLKTEEMLNLFEKIPILPHTEVIFEELKRQGIEIALISSGLPQIVIENLANRLKADHAYGFELEIRDNLLTGKIKGSVIKKNGKAIVLDQLLTKKGLKRKNCVVVADDRNNASIFYPEALKIGYNPDFLLILKSDVVIKGSLIKILSVFKETHRRPRHSLLRHEVVREFIHAGGLLAIFTAAILGIYPTVLLLSLITLIYAISELARIQRKHVPIISHVTLNAATPSERYEFTTAPILFALGVTLSLLIFQSPINFASIAIVSLGDSAASVFGGFFGKIALPFNKGKSLEGSVACFGFAFLGAILFLSPPRAFFGAIIGMVVESLPLPINDNLSMPLITGFLLGYIP